MPNSQRRIQKKSCLGLLSLALLPLASADLSVESIHPPAIVNNIGKLAVVGQYDGISQYTYAGQQNSITSPYYDSIIAQVNNNVFINQGTSDGRVSAVCQINDTLFMAGNFTTIGNVSVPGGLAKLNASSGAISAVGPALNGNIFTLYCDSTNNSVYAGGDFTFDNSTGTAVYHLDSSSWSAPLFGGFATGARINSIQSFNNSLIFAGAFSGLANSSFTGSSTTLSNSTLLSSQRISFAAASITAAGSADNNDPRNIICPSANSNWVMRDGQSGSWSSLWPYNFQPSKVRLFNLQAADAGVKMFRLRSFPSNGIMNLTYTNSSSNTPFYCDAFCPLPLSSDQQFADFEFVNPINTRGIQIEIVDTYGTHGGLSGIQLFQSDSVTYANNSYNVQESCEVPIVGPQSAVQGAFVEPNVPGSTYVSVQVTDSNQIPGIAVRMEPNITISGNYSILLFSPGCVQDGTCAARPGITVSVQATANGAPVTTTLYETNNYDKYDVIYTGQVDKISSSFRPSVVISPLAGEKVPFTFVADRIQVILNSFEEHISINSIFEFNPANFTTSLSNGDLPVGNTTINSIGSLLSDNAEIRALYVDGSNMLVGGNFSSQTLGSNMFKVANNGAAPVAGNGLNGPVNGFQTLSSGLAIAYGLFTSPVSSPVTGTSNLALYNLNSNSWGTVGLGTDGEVTHANTFNLNGTAAVGFSGVFDKVFANTSEAIPVNGFGLWVTQDNTWFQKSTFSSLFLQARLSAAATYNKVSFYAGYIRMFQSASSGSSFLNADFSVSKTPFTFVDSPPASNASLQARNSILQTTGNQVNTGVFANSSLTILGGHFKAQAKGQTFSNLLILNDNVVQGLPAGSINDDATIYDLYVSNNMLFAGGDFTGNISSNQVGGLFFYDLQAHDFMTIQPPGVSGGQAVVTNIEFRPNTNDLIVAGNFEQAGGLACSSMCIYDMSAQRWQSPSPGLTGLVSSMAFIGNDVLVLAGDLSLNNTQMFLAQYDFVSTEYQSFGVQSTSLPGPINSFVLNGNKLDSVFASGLDSSTGAAYIAHWNGQNWTRIDSVLQPGSIVAELALLELENPHTSNPVLPVDEVLLISGSLILKDFGNVSSVFFDGSAWQPAYITTMRSGGSGHINSFFSQSTRSFGRIFVEKHMAKGLVVLIALAIALGLSFVCVGLGLLVAYTRKRRQGYVQAPSRVSEAEMAETVPPPLLFEEMSSQRLVGGPRRRASGLL